MFSSHRLSLRVSSVSRLILHSSFFSGGLFASYCLLEPFIFLADISIIVLIIFSRPAHFRCLITVLLPLDFSSFYLIFCHFIFSYFSAMTATTSTSTSSHRFASEPRPPTQIKRRDDRIRTFNSFDDITESEEEDIQVRGIK